MIEVSYEQVVVLVFSVFVIAFLSKRWGELVMSRQLRREYHNFLSPIRNHCDSNLKDMCGENWEGFRFNMVELLELNHSEDISDSDLSWKHHLPLLQMIRMQLHVMTLLSPRVESSALEALYFDENKELRRR